MAAFPKNLSSIVPEILSDPANPGSLSSGLWSPRGDSREREGFLFGEAQRGDVQLLLAAGVPREWIAKLTGFSAREVQRIGGVRLSGQPPTERAAA